MKNLDVNTQKNELQYGYHFLGDAIRHYVWASKEQMDKARKYFKQKDWEFPPGIAGVGIFKNGSLEFTIDYKAKNEGKKSIENLGLLSPY